MLASFDPHVFWVALSSGPYWRGALLALGLACAALGAAVVIGFFLALGRESRLRAVRTFVFLYNWIFRATPTLLQLLFIWNALPQLSPFFSGTWFTPFLAAFVALSLNEAAYMCEIIRAGLLSVDPGQELAGRALGLTRRQILRRVIVPQAIRIVIPPTGNEFEAYSAALVYYLVIVSVLMALQSRLERRFTWTSRRRPRISAPAVPAISHDAR